MYSKYRCGVFEVSLWPRSYSSNETNYYYYNIYPEFNKIINRLEIVNNITYALTKLKPNTFD